MTSRPTPSARSKRSRASAESSEGSEQVCVESMLKFVFATVHTAQEIQSWACVGRCCAPPRDARQAGARISASKAPAAPNEHLEASEGGHVLMQTGPAKKARRTPGTGAASKAASRAPAQRKAAPRKKPEPLAPPVGARRGRGKE